MTQTIRVSETLRAGRPATFVRWYLAAGGWRFELLTGSYVGALPDRYVVRDRDGETRLLDRSTWAPVIA